MPRIRIFLLVAAIIAFSLAVGAIASRWPHFCQREHWCAPDWPHHV